MLASMLQPVLILRTYLNVSHGVAPPIYLSVPDLTSARRREALTFENMNTLDVKICSLAGGIVDVPFSIKVVDLRSPDVATSWALGSGVNHFLRSSLQAIESGRSTNLNILPRCGEEVVVSSRPHNEWIRSLWITKRVFEIDGWDKA